MSGSAIRLPLRTLAHSRGNGLQWICRRCLATTIESPPKSNPMPPLTPPSASSPTKKDASEAESYDPTLPSSQRDYRLTATDFYLKKALPQKIPPQYLQHSTSPLLHPSEQAQRAQTSGHKRIVGVVVSAGKMDKTVRVRVPRLVWNKRVKKHFQKSAHHLVHDPNNSLVPGDVISLHRLRVSTAVRHVLASLVTPFGTPVDARPAIPTADERLARYKEKRFAKLHRRSLRREAAKGNGEAIDELRAMGLDPGKGVEAGKGETANLERGTEKKRTPTKGAILGRKGQKLPKGVLPGGKEEVGKINERSQKNKGKAMKFEAQAEANLLEAKEKGEVLEGMGLATKTEVPVQGPILRESTGRKGE